MEIKIELVYSAKIFEYFAFCLSTLVNLEIMCKKYE